MLDDKYWSTYEIHLLPGEIDKLRQWLSFLMSDFKLYSDLPDEELLQVFVRREFLEVHSAFNRAICDLKRSGSAGTLTSGARQDV